MANNKITMEKADRSLIDAVIWQESRGNAFAISRCGALGVMQLMPATAKECLQELDINPSLFMPFDLEQNKMLGTYYLNKMLKIFNGDVELALAAYNAGPGRVQKVSLKGKFSFRRISLLLPKETRNYVKKIMVEYVRLLQERKEFH
jgi:soluble lytic murein transglycosylase-like protein